MLVFIAKVVYDCKRGIVVNVGVLECTFFFPMKLMFNDLLDDE
jgi:hypothetical protein